MTGAPRPRAAISWSGGKDSCAALQRARLDYDIVSMVTMFDEAGSRSRSHGLRPEVLAAQAERLGLRRVHRSCSWDTYDAAFSDALSSLASEDITHVIFGDILFDEHRRWAEDICAARRLTAVEPLWGQRTDMLYDEWTGSGAVAIIVTTRAALLDERWLGRVLTPDLRSEFIRLGVDPCGERGEYHTVVTNAPLFRAPLRLRHLAPVRRSDCWALDVELDDASGH